MTKYVIDIVGTCNLKCPSRGRRQRYAYTPALRRLMDSNLFCTRSGRMSNEIVLYNWGEPLTQQIDEDRIVIYADGSVRA
jgi:hypothetical protein